MLANIKIIKILYYSECICVFFVLFLLQMLYLNKGLMYDYISLWNWRSNWGKAWDGRSSFQKIVHNLSKSL